MVVAASLQSASVEGVSDYVLAISERLALKRDEY